MSELVYAGTDPSQAFADVPADHWAANDIQTLRQMEVTNGVGDNVFGMGRTLTRAEFVTFLAALFKWETKDTTAVVVGEWYAPYISAAVAQGAVTAQEGENFRPNDPITREEMAVILTRSLGYDVLAEQLNALPAPFQDVKNNIGYITIAKDFGVIAGMSATSFAPNATATREQAAAMMARLYNKLREAESVGGTINGFYAIRSAGQSQYISLLDMVSFGWRRLEVHDGTVMLNMTQENDNSYNQPEGWEEVLATTKAQNKKALLMIPLYDNAAALLAQPALRQTAAELIADAAQNFDGVTIDFEGLRGASAKADFTAFLKTLKSMPAMSAKILVVAVQPARASGQAYFDGYDFKAIGEQANYVILMAHDYQPKSLTEAEMASDFTTTPLTPIHEVYYALQAITNADSGVGDKSKVLLQFSFATAQWKSRDGQILNKTPYTPGYEAIQERIAQGNAERYSTKYENPFLTFTSAEDGADNIVWYENQRSIRAKMRLSALFGCKGVSLWRLGLIPEEVVPALMR